MFELELEWGILMRWLPLLQVFILLHTVDDREVLVKSSEIISLTRPGGLMVEDANCLIALTDGKHLTTRENCKEVIEMLNKEDKR
jgi:hypothetical protein